MKDLAVDKPNFLNNILEGGPLKRASVPFCLPPPISCILSLFVQFLSLRAISWTEPKTANPH